MSAFGGKADMSVCGCLLSRSLLGGKRTCVAALHESAFDPRRTSRSALIWPRVCLGQRRAHRNDAAIFWVHGAAHQRDLPGRRIAAEAQLAHRVSTEQGV